MNTTNHLSELDNVKFKIKEIIANDLEMNIPIEEIEDTMSLYDDGLGLDSIAIVNFMVELESKFNIKFEENEISSSLFSNVNSLANCIMEKRVAG